MASLQVVHNEGQLQDVIKKYQLETCTTFVKQRSRKTVEFHDLQDISKFKIRFEDGGHPNSKCPKFRVDGVPYIIISTDVYLCHQGPVRNKKEKLNEHSYTAASRRRIKTTKKQDCPASIRVRRIVQFPDYKIDNITEWKKRKVSKDLKSNFCAETHRQLLIVVTLPDLTEHENHLTGETAKYVQPLDKDIIAHIKQLALDGHRNVSSIQLMVKEFVKTLGVSDEDADGSRFQPSKENIRSHVYQAIVASNFQSAHDDQLEVRKIVCEWQSIRPEDNFFFRPASVSEENELTSMLFVAQTKFQRELILKYGEEITLMDSTFKITKYDIPLYQLCVRTNVSFAIVASFLVSRDCKYQVAEALQLLKEWNPDWQPRYFICDYDLREIGALEATFQGSQVLLCDFHRQQAWQRWLSNKCHGMQKEKDTILKQLQKIADAASVEEFDTLVSDIRTCQTYKENVKFKSWLEKKWLSECERWVFCYRRNLSNLINTTNGVEVQHRIFKHAYLKEFGVGKSLTNLVTVLVCNFLPDAERSYKMRNMKGMSSVRQYSRDIPEFLHNRPKKFLDHCLDRIPPNIDDISIETLNASTFMVKSLKGSQAYYITIEDQIPRCPCKDFIRLNWPCKHILAICLRDGIKSVAKFMNQAQFVLDNTQFPPENQSTENNDDDIITLTTNYSTQNENQTDGENEIRKKCLEQVNSLYNNLYMTDDVDLLHFVNSKIIEINEHIGKSVPHVAGLPVGRKRKRWQRRALTKFKGYKQRKVSYDNSEKTAADQDGQSVRSINDLLHEKNYEEALTLLWTAPNSDDQIATVGPYCLTYNSFKYLKTTLSDEVIDAYLHSVCQQYQHCLHVNCVVMTAIFSGQGNIHSHLKQENILQYEYCVGAVNEGGCHWILMIVRPNKRQIIYLNPLGEVDKLKQVVVQQWYAFLQGRWEANIDTKPPDEWILNCPTHSRQIDGVSCGVYVLKFAENYLAKRRLMLKWQDVQQERKNIGIFLLSKATILRDATVPITHAPPLVQLVEQERQNVSDECFSKMNTDNDETLHKQNKQTVDEEQCTEQQNDCRPVQRICDEKPEQTVNSLELEELEETNEKSFFIDEEIARLNIDAAISRVDKIIKLKEKKKLWMKRHYNFMKFRRVVGKGYGCAIFSIQAIMFVKEELRKRFFTDVTQKVYTKHGRIVGMEDVEMDKLFLEDRFLASVYLANVLVTEGLAAILQHYAGFSYKEADKECQVVEGFRFESQALQAGFILSSEKKKNLTGKMKKTLT